MIPIVAPAQPSVLPALSVAAVPLGDAFLAMMMAIGGEQPVAALAGQVDVPVVIDDEIPQADDPDALTAHADIVLPLPLPVPASAPLPPTRDIITPSSQLLPVVPLTAPLMAPRLLSFDPAPRVVQKGLSGLLPSVPEQAEPDGPPDVAPDVVTVPAHIGALPPPPFSDAPQRARLMPVTATAAKIEPRVALFPAKGDVPAERAIADHLGFGRASHAPLPLPDLQVTQTLPKIEPAVFAAQATNRPAIPVIPITAQGPPPQPITHSADGATPPCLGVPRTLWAALPDAAVKRAEGQPSMPPASGPVIAIAATQSPPVQTATSASAVTPIVQPATLTPAELPAAPSVLHLMHRPVVPKEPRPSTAESAFAARVSSGSKSPAQTPLLLPEPPVSTMSEPEIPPDEVAVPAAPDANAPLRPTTDPGTATAPFLVQTPHHATPRAVITTDPVSIANLPQTLVSLAKHDEKQGVALRLDPVELGAIQVTMRGDDKAMTITVIVDRPETRDLLRKHADQFVADLRQSGITSPTISFDLAGQQGFAHRTPPRQDVLPDLVPDSFVPTPPTPNTLPHIMQSGALDLRL